MHCKIIIIIKRSNERNEPPNAARACVLDLDREISVTEVDEVLLKLKVNKAPGEDGIPPGVFKALDNTVIEMLAILFSNVMRSGEYPNCWSTGIIQSVALLFLQKSNCVSGRSCLAVAHCVILSHRIAVNSLPITFKRVIPW